MRLLQRSDQGAFSLKGLNEEKLPKYAILSHTWFLNNDLEVTFQDLTHGSPDIKPDGYAKLRFCYEQAAKDGLQFCWVDTCCINKESSAELQEAITAMFSWYRNSDRCYAYLWDVSVDRMADGGLPSLHLWESRFRKSRWFTRGWTLQELLAPKSVEFFSKEGVRLGDKISLRTQIHEITGIPIHALKGESLDAFSVDERFSWAANRQTKRPEDKAYCLLGIFRVFMPLLYGEKEAALERLRRVIDDEQAIPKDLLSKLPVDKDAAFNSLRNQHAPTCLRGTRVEILETVNKWVVGTDEKSILWLNGIAGSGKSTIARTIAETNNKSKVLGGSFFFSRDGGGPRKASKLVTTLASQLAHQIPGAEHHICEAIKRQRAITEQSFRDQWEQLIINPLSKLSKQFPLVAILLVIDALDECNNDNDIRMILKSLSTAKALTNIRLRIFITSRPKTVIRQTLNKIPKEKCETLVLHETPRTLVDRDLGLFFEVCLSTIREERDFEDDWPGVRKIKRLVETSSGLFAWAAAACAFIREGRLQLVVNTRIDNIVNGFASGTGPQERMNEIYTNVMRPFAQQDNDEHERRESRAVLREVLGTAISLYHPLPMASLAMIIDRPLGDVKAALADLHTIFQIPDEDSRPVLLHHPAFKDFMLNREHCVTYGLWVDEKQTHKAIGDNCLALMSKRLRVNICDLESPNTSQKDLDPVQIKDSIPPELQYACLHWAEHYRQSGIHLSDGDKIDNFFRKHFLHWLEAINVMGKSTKQGAIITLYHSLLQAEYNEYQIPFVSDARRLMVKFQDIIKQTPLQVYSALLAFAPPTNKLKTHFRDQKQPLTEEIRMAEASVHNIKDDFNYVSDLVFTLDGKRIASGSNFEAVRLWDVATRATVRKYDGGPTNKMSSIAISPDGKILAGGSDDTSITAWDIETGAFLYSIKSHTGWVNSVAFSPDGELLASGSTDQSIALFNAATGKELKRFDNRSSSVNSIAFSPHGSVVATGSADEMIRLWNISKDTIEILMTLYGHSGPLNSVRFSPSGDRIASGSDDMTIKIWDTETGTNSMTLTGHTNRVISVAFSPDSRLLASGSEDKTIKLWDATHSASLVTLTAHATGINSVVFSPCSRLLASSSFDDEVRLWEINAEEKGTPALIGKLDDFEDPATLPAPGTRIPGSSKTIQSAANYKAHSNTVTRIVYSPDGKWVASGSQDSTIRLWMERQERWVLKGHTGGVDHLAFSPNSRLIASGSSDRSVRVWNVATGLSYHTLEGHLGSILCVLFSPNGQLLGTSSTDRTARLWDPESGIALRTLTGHLGAVKGLSFSPDNHTIVTWSEDTTALIWDLSTKAPITTLRDHRSPVQSITFSPDGELLLSCGADGMICVWTRKDWVLSVKAFYDFHARPLSLNNSQDGASIDREGVLWLRGKFHATDVATHGNVAVMGHSSGSISFLGLV